jgi:signal transduction histidine kinase
MKRQLLSLARRYQSALRNHLKQGKRASLKTARGLGSQALAAGLQTLDLAKLHEQTLVSDVLPGCSPGERAALVEQAGIFFRVAITPVETEPRDVPDDPEFIKKIIETLSRRTVELAAANLELSQEITHRKATEAALKKSERHTSLLLKESDRLQEQLRRLSRQILSAQEEERKRISRELHDVIAQTLTGINIRLTTLKIEASIRGGGLGRNIARTQRLVEHAVRTVHRFARELRPTVLDDLGLIAALHSFMKGFTARTGIRTRLSAFAEIEALDGASRTVLFRVAQEALTNVARHAGASHAEVSIQKVPGEIVMKIEDDGKSFSVERALRRRTGRHLGLLGMRERVEMVGGCFSIESAPGHGTAILARIPAEKGRARERRTPAAPPRDPT